MNKTNFQPHIGWHDNTIHGFRIQEIKAHESEIIFDVDHIVEWRKSTDGEFSFLVAPADLIFHRVTSLIISIDYEIVPAMVQPMVINEIHLHEKQNEYGYHFLACEIEIQWPPKGRIAFAAKNYSLNLRANPVETDNQSLPRT